MAAKEKELDAKPLGESRASRPPERPSKLPERVDRAPCSPVKTPLSVERQVKMNRFLLKSAKKGKWDMVERLLKGGAQASARDEVYLYTAVTYAAAAGKTKLVGMMIDNGVVPNIHDTAGRAALIKAMAGGHEETAKLLVKKGDYHVEDDLCMRYMKADGRMIRIISTEDLVRAITDG